MPIKLLISFLAKCYISIYLGITLPVIDTSCYEMGTFLFEKVLLINTLFQIIIYGRCQFYRRRIFKVGLFSETDTINSITALRNPIILCIKNLIVDLISTIVLKGFFDYTPCASFIMTKQSLNILKDKDLGFTLYYNTCELSK